MGVCVGHGWAESIRENSGVGPSGCCAGVGVQVYPVLDGIVVTMFVMHSTAAWNLNK